MTIAAAAKRRGRPAPEADGAHPAPAPPPPADAGRFEPALPLDSIAPSPHNPRKTFDEAELAKLADSIRGPKGVLQPIVVRPLALWQRVCRFAADQFRKYEATGSDYGLSRSQFEAAGVVFKSQAEYDAAVAQLVDEGRAEPSQGLNLSWHAVAGALAPVTSPECMGEADRFELVCGERRWRASKLAGRDTIPAVVRDLDDKAAAETAVVENDQREDVPPLEQAEGYRRLVELGDDAATIAAKIGRPEAYVVGRLQLLHLAPELQEDLRGGRLPFGHAWLLSRLQPADQLELRDGLFTRYGPPADRRVVWSADELRRRIRETATHPLAAAPWKWADADLVPEAGPCTTCPKRSGNNRTLFDELLNGDGKKAKPPELCTDGACYRKKREAFVELQVRKAAAANGGEALKVSRQWQPRAKDVLGADRYEVLTPKAAKAVPADQVKTAVIVEGGWSDDGQQVGRVVKVRLKKASAGSTRNDESWRRQQAQERKKAEAGRAASLKANGLVAERAAAAFAGVAFPAAATAALRQLAVALPDLLWSDAARLVCKRRGVGQEHRADRDALAKLAKGLPSAAELVGLVAELVAARQSFDWGRGHSTGHLSPAAREFWRAFGVDPARLRKEAEAAAKKPAAKPAAKPSANGHAKPKGKGKRAKAAPAGDAGDEDEPARSKPPAASPAKWRSLPVLDLEPSAVAAGVLHLAGVETCGELADALDMADTLGLDPPDLRAMQRAVDGVRADDGEPHQTLCPPRACRVCGCTDDDCSDCVEKTGQPCHWVEDDLCSACLTTPDEAARAAFTPSGPKGESIDALDVSPDDLSAAHLSLAFKDRRKLAKPLLVPAVSLNGRPHVVTAALEGWPNPTRSWEVRPLHTLDEFVRRHGVLAPQFVPAEPTAADPWVGVRVLARTHPLQGPGEYVIGPKGEQRRLVEPPRADPAKARPKKKAAAAGRA